MTTYDGVPCKIVERNEKGHIYLEVMELMPWPDAPELGSKFWITSDDEYFVNYNPAH